MNENYINNKITKIIDEIMQIANAEESEENDSKRFVLEEKRNLWCARLAHYVNSGRLM